MSPRLTFAQGFAIIACGVAYVAALVLLFITSWPFTLAVLALSVWSVWVLARDDAKAIGADVDELERMWDK